MLATVIEIWNKILTSNLFNFVLMLVFLGWIIKKCDIAGALERGRKSIEERITLSNQKREDALKNLYDTQAEGANVDKEIFETLEKAEQNAVIVGEKLVEEAKVQSQTFGKNTQKTIDTAIENLKINLTNETAQKAVELAKQHIKKQLADNRELHIRYINESIDALKGVDL